MRWDAVAPSRPCALRLRWFVIPFDFDLKGVGKRCGWFVTRRCRTRSLSVCAVSPSGSGCAVRFPVQSQRAERAETECPFPHFVSAAPPPAPPPTPNPPYWCSLCAWCESGVRHVRGLRLGRASSPSLGSSSWLPLVRLRPPKAQRVPCPCTLGYDLTSRSRSWSLVLSLNSTVV